MIGYDEALGLIPGAFAPLPAETIAIANAFGRTLREDLHARSDAPAAPVSAMDGYAVRAADVAEDIPLAIVAEAAAGGAERLTIAPGEAARIFTGAMVPHGADLVIMQEYAQVASDGVRFAEGHGPARHIREAGSDFAKGALLVAAGTMIDARRMMLCAAADVGQLAVAEQARVAILATGDELAAPGTAHRRAGAIPETSSLAIAGLVAQSGGRVVRREIRADDLASLSDLASELVAEADLLIVIGGASVGDRDLAKPMLDALGLELIFSRIAIKPGKPVWCGRVGRTAVLGLPGNPTSAMVTARLFLPHVLGQLHGAAIVDEWHMLPLAAELPATDGRETFVRAAWQDDGLAPVANQASGAQLALGSAEYLIRCPAHQPALPTGTKVRALRF